ncbi:MAG: hypothetical protein ABL892_10060 [Thiobacillaceae bacterium]
MAPIIAMSGLVFAGRAAAAALFYGVAVALVASVLMVWRERTAIRHPEWDGRKLFGVFVLTGLERLAAVVLMLGIGFGVLKLSPLPLLVGLVLAQMAWLAAALSYKNKK